MPAWLKSTLSKTTLGLTVGISAASASGLIPFPYNIGAIALTGILQAFQPRVQQGTKAVAVADKAVALDKIITTAAKQDA